MIQLQWHGETTTFRTYSYAQHDAEYRNTSLLTTSVIVIKYDENSSFCQSTKQRKCSTRIRTTGIEFWRNVLQKCSEINEQCQLAYNYARKGRMLERSFKTHQCIRLWEHESVQQTIQNTGFTIGQQRNYICVHVELGLQWGSIWWSNVTAHARFTVHTCEVSAY